jgi:hypothetical protein
VAVGWKFKQFGCRPQRPVKYTKMQHWSPCRGNQKRILYNSHEGGLGRLHLNWRYDAATQVSNKRRIAGEEWTKKSRAELGLSKENEIDYR